MQIIVSKNVDEDVLVFDSRAVLSGVDLAVFVTAGTMSIQHG